MNSQLTDEFIAHFRALPAEIQVLARKQYQLWKQNPAHPSLHFKHVHSQESLYSVRIGRGWRAVGLVEGNMITWFWIGSHADYDALIS